MFVATITVRETMMLFKIKKLNILLQSEQYRLIADVKITAQKKLTYLLKRIHLKPTTIADDRIRYPFLAYYRPSNRPHAVSGFMVPVAVHKLNHDIFH